MRQKFLSPRRLREWRDVYKQLLELTNDIGWKRNTVPAEYDELHQALLTGLLGNLGCRQLDADFARPRTWAPAAFTFGCGREAPLPKRGAAG